jgi:hypothetical protein
MQFVIEAFAIAGFMEQSREARPDEVGAVVVVVVCCFGTCNNEKRAAKRGKALLKFPPRSRTTTAERAYISFIKLLKV